MNESFKLRPSISEKIPVNPPLPGYILDEIAALCSLLPAEEDLGREVMKESLVEDLGSEGVPIKYFKNIRTYLKILEDRGRSTTKGFDILVQYFVFCVPLCGPALLQY